MHGGRKQPLFEDSGGTATPPFGPLEPQDTLAAAVGFVQRISSLLLCPQRGGVAPALPGPGQHLWEPHLIIAKTMPSRRAGCGDLGIWSKCVIAHPVPAHQAHASVCAFPLDKKNLDSYLADEAHAAWLVLRVWEGRVRSPGFRAASEICSV